MRNFTLLLVLLTIASASVAQQSYLERYIQGTGGQINDTLDNGTVVTLDLSSDDVEQENDEVDSQYDDDLDAGWEGDPEDQNLLTLGLRFTGLDLLQGSKIDSAFVVFHAHEGKGAEDVAKLTIVGELTDDAVTFDDDNFNENYLLTDRPRTTAEVDWTVDEDWIIWQPYKTADIGAIIEEIVAQQEWEPGNALALIFLPEDQGPSTVENAREFTAFENIADPEDVDPNGVAGDGTNHPERRPYLQVYVDGPLGTQRVEERIFRCYPNPVSNGTLQVQLESNESAQIEVVDASGQVVLNETTSESRTVLNVDHLSSGLYFLHVQQNGVVQTKKVTIK